MQDRGREESKIAGGARNVERARERHWFASVDRLGACELFQITLNQVGDAQENFRALRRRFSRPFRKRLLRCSDGKVDIARVAVRDLRVGFSRCGFDVVEITPADRLNKLAVDEVLDRRRH